MRRTGISIALLAMTGVPAIAMASKIDQQALPESHLSINSASADLLILRWTDGEVEKGLRSDWVGQHGSRTVAGGEQIPAWGPNGIEVVSLYERLQQGDEAEAPALGYVYHRYPDFAPRLWTERIDRPQPERLKAAQLADPALFRLVSGADERYAVAVHPRAVHALTTVIDGNDISGEKVLSHTLFIEMPWPLEAGIAYRLELKTAAGIQEISFTYAPLEQPTPAIQVNQIGYRTDDPFKRGYLSLWMGTGGGYHFSVDRFELLEVGSNRSVYSGRIRTGFPASRPEAFSSAANLVGTDVHYLDFDEFQIAGEYRAHVPGVGVSLPFRIGEATWQSAFRTAMQGFLSHRSGIELGPPLTPYRRPRPMHPVDGVRVFAIPHTVLEGESAIVRDAILAKLASGVPVGEWQQVTEGWGGYMDAGDWDRRSLHLTASRHLAELFSLFPDYFETLKLVLPEDEAQDQIPDLLNEVIWNVAFYRRLQTAAGGVRGGIESTAHPRPGEASWEETLVLGAFAQDPYSSYSYAAAASQLGRLLQKYDPQEADAYAQSALRAWDWAEANSEIVLSEAVHRTPQFDRAKAALMVCEMRFVAAAELFAQTQETRFHDAFRKEFGGAGSGPDALGACFLYARLPEEITCAELREAANARIVEAAQRALAFGVTNAYGLHTQTPTAPVMGYVGFYSVPEMIHGPVLPRAFILTGDPRYLRAALQAAHFSAGANPLNKTFTTGVGHDWPRNPLHIDSRVTGQSAPAGITIYGPMDASAPFRFSEWVHRWHLQDQLPPSRTWPAAQWHVDLFRWPAMSEYTIHQTFRPVAYYWGFLAARPEQN